MHYTTDYSGLVGKAKSDKAIEDCKGYLGARRYEELHNLIRKEPRDGRTFQQHLTYLRFALSMGGIQGYPARVMVIRALRTR